MGYEARWEDNKQLCCSVDTIENAISCICSLTTGKGKIYLYQFHDHQPPTFIKIIEIID